MLDNLKLDDSNAAALAAILRGNKGVGLLSVERNNLKENGLLEIVQAAVGHASLRELRVAEQKQPISTTALVALIELMETSQVLLKLGLGKIRDEKLLNRLQAATMANQDRQRQKRRELGGAVPPEPAWVAFWETKRNVNTGSISEGSMHKADIPKVWDSTP